MPQRLPPISVDMWSEVVCPWCFIGKRRVDQRRRAEWAADGDG
jgi:predicted DsbA family dithiol-disulfide isomerase